MPPFAPGGPGIPYFVTEGAPRAGQPFQVQWTTRPTVPGDLPAMPTLLMVSLEASAPLPLDWLGAPGCWLQVAPDFVMVPGGGSILTQEGGRVLLDWTPNLSLMGREFWSQLLVVAPGVNAAQFLVSPALHVQIGG